MNFQKRNFKYEIPFIKLPKQIEIISTCKFQFFDLKQVKLLEIL